MDDQKSLYQVYSSTKGLNGLIWTVGLLWVVLGLAYGNIMVGIQTALMGGGAGVVALFFVYYARNYAFRFGGVIAMAVVSVVVFVNAGQHEEQQRLASQPNAAQAEAYQQLEGQEFAIKSVTLRQPDQTTGQAELKEQLPNSLNYPIVELKKVDDIWYVGCKTIEGPVLWLKDMYWLHQDFNMLGRCPPGLSASTYAER
jgi:hypothetical protein